MYIYIYTQIAYIVLNSSPFGPAGVLPPSLAVGGRGGDGGDGDITSVWPTETDGDKWPGALC